MFFSRPCLTQDKVSRCLFPTDNSTRNLSLKNSHFLTPSRTKIDPADALSFDTPQRSLLSPNGFKSKVKDFVLGTGSYGTVVKGKYKSKFYHLFYEHKIYF